LPETLGDLQYALSITQVLEILAPLPVIPVPGSPPGILGLVHWRDRAVPMLDMSRRFDLPGTNGHVNGRLMIVRSVFRKREQVAGFIVHPAIRMLRLPVNYNAGCTQALIPAKFVKGVVEIDGQVTIFPDISRILEY